MSELPIGVHQWYIHPLDSYSNQAIADELGVDAETHINKPCGRDRGPRNLFECSEEQFLIVKSSRSDKSIRMRAFYDQSEGGRLFEFHFRSRATTGAEFLKRELRKKARTAT